MDVIVAVLKDLYLFAIKYRFGFVGSKQVNEPPALWSPIQPPAITPPRVPPAVIQSTSPLSKEIGYIFIPSAFLYVLPTRVFDGVICELPYGSVFTVIGSQGKWLDVQYEDVRGWVHFDDIVKNADALDPHFSKRERYGHNHPDTIKLRTILSDMFHATPFDIALSDVEYVSYKLQKQGLKIVWPAERPRAAGTWQRLLKGVTGVHLDITPKTDTVMEYINPDNTGHVAYVEAVYPDESIFISEVGYNEEGQYYERTLTKDEWIELRPVFIEVL